MGGDSPLNTSDNLNIVLFFRIRLVIGLKVVAKSINLKELLRVLGTLL